MNGQSPDPAGPRSGPASEPEAIRLPDNQQRALRELMAAMDDGVRWLILTGPEGIGKTTVLRRLLAEVEGAGADAVALEGSALPGPDEIANALREELRLPARRGGMLRRAASLADVIASRRGSGRPLVVVLDDAHAVAWRGLGLLATLAARSQEGEPEAYVVLAGAPALIDTAGRAWGHARGRPAAAQVGLEALTSREVREYLERRARAQGKQSIDFSNLAVQRIANCSSGIPGRIDVLCDALAAHPSTRVSDHVTADTVDEVAEHLGFESERRPDPGRPGSGAGDEAARDRDRRPSSRARRRAWRWALLALGGAVLTGLLGVFGADLIAVPAARLSDEIRNQANRWMPQPEPASGSRPDAKRRESASRPAGPSGAPRAPVAPRQSVAPAPKPPAPSPQQVVDTFAAAREGQVAALTQLLAAGVSPNARDADGLTPLMHAIVRGQLPAVHALLDRGADINARTRGGVTPAMLAVINDREDALKALLDRGAGVNARTGAGWTALTYAAWKGDPGMVRTLLSRGADPNLADRQGWTPRQYAQRMMDCPGRSRSGEGAGAGEAPPGGDCGRHSEVVPLLPGESAR